MPSLRKAGGYPFRPPSALSGGAIGGGRSATTVLSGYSSHSTIRRTAGSEPSRARTNLSGQHQRMSGYPAMSGGTIRTLEPAVWTLGEQLEAVNDSLLSERRRVDDLQALLAEERRQIDRLHLDLADAITAERIAAGEAAALRAIVAELRARPWWRRWWFR